MDYYRRECYFDIEFYNQLKNSSFIRKIPADIRINNTSVTIRSIKMNEITYNFEEEFEFAKDINKAKDTVIKQFSKLGDTEFYVSQIKLSQDFDRFIPISKINDIRRQAILLLQKELKENYPKSTRDTNVSISEYPYKSLDYSYNVSNKLSKNLYEECGANVYEMAFECYESKSQAILMKTKHCLRHFAGICNKECKDDRKLLLIDEFGNKFPLAFDCQKCFMKIISE